MYVWHRNELNIARRCNGDDLAESGYFYEMFQDFIIIIIVVVAVYSIILTITT